MKTVWLTSLLLLLVPLAIAYPPGQIQRLARLVNYVGGGGHRGDGHHSLALARSLDTPSALARRQGSQAEVPPDSGLTDFEDEDMESVSKRQFDDYGHMRFGRSSTPQHKKFDDYGHMRYGK